VEKRHLSIGQGYLMQPHPQARSRLILKLKMAKLHHLMVGGGAKLIQEIEVNVD
jgi:hypothetical protein